MSVDGEECLLSSILPGFANVKILELFCGIGGLSLGFERAGFELSLAVDNWRDALDTYKKNHLYTECLEFDLAAGEGALYELLHPLKGEIAGLIGGPPCQGYSTMGDRDSSDPRNLLWRSVLFAAETLEPEFVVIENVEGILHIGDKKLPHVIQSELEKLGYKAEWKILVSADYGVPQLRKRFIMIANKGSNHIGFPNPTHAQVPDLFNAERWRTVIEAIGDLPPLLSGEKSDVYTMDPITDYQRLLRSDCDVLTHHQAVNHPPSLVRAISFIPDGGNRKSIPDEYQPKSGFHNSYARLASNKPAIAVTSNMRKPSSARATHPFQNRGLTVREGLRLQGFPDNFTLSSSRTSQYLQVGNAVPVPLAFAIASHLGKALFPSIVNE